MADQYFNRLKYYVSREDEMKLHRIGFGNQKVLMNTNHELMLEVFLFRYARKYKTQMTENVARMASVLYCEKMGIDLPPEYQRRMGKEWFEDFIIRHPRLYAGMILRLKSLTFVFVKYFQLY